MSEDAAKLATLLSALTQPNTEAIRAAEAELKPILKDPRCVGALTEILAAGGPENEAIRLTAAVLLRKRLPSHYDGFPDDAKSSFKTQLLTMLSSEGSRQVRHGEASVAAAIAKIEGAKWIELFQFISTAAQDANADARELAFFLLSEMTDTVGDQLSENFAQMAQMFATALNDSDHKVQITSVRALGQLLSYLADEPTVEQFAGLLPNVLNVANECMKRHDEETVSVVLDVLYDLAYSPSMAITAHLSSTVQFCLMVLTDGQIEMGVRDSAALVVATMAECKPKTFGKDPNLVNTVVEALFVMIENSQESAAGALFESNPAWREDIVEGQGFSSDEDFDSPTETSMAQGTLDMLACELPKKYIFQPVIERVVARLQSQQPNQRKAGIACLGVMAEGCSEPIRQHLAEIMPHVLSAAGDGDAQVRECSCFALGQLSEHCQPEVLSYSSKVLPTVFTLLDDSTVSVQATSCYVLEMFCERLEPEGVRPLLDPLVKKLASMLETTTKRSVQEMAVAAIAATAVAAEDEFAPYIEGIATLMQKLMALTDENMFSLRGRALECMGHMAIAVGKEHFRPYFSNTMVCACEGLTFDSTDLHEFAYAVFANLSKVMGEEFAPVLPELVPYLTKAIDADEGQIQQEVEEEKFSALDDSDDEDEDGANYVLHVRTALLEAKKGAITAIGEMAAHTGAAFVPYLEVSMKSLTTAAGNWHPLIKSECAEALPSMVVPSVAANHDGEINWEKGNVTCENPMSPHTAAIVTAVLDQLVKLMTDEDPDTAGKACEGVQSVIELCGPHALLPYAEPCLKNTFELISYKAPSQLMHENGQQEEDGDHEPYMTSVCDLVGSFARVMGAQFTPQLGQFLPPVCAFAKTSRPASDRSMALGCLGEIAQEMESSIAEYWPNAFLPAVLAGLADPDENVKRNSAFCAGVCAEGLGDSIVAQYPDLMKGLSPLFVIDSSANDSSAACVDNAAAAMARMIMASPSNVPLGEVLPVILKNLPLKNDMTENETVYKCILGLIQLNNADAAANKDEIRRVFQESIAEGSKVDDEIKAKLSEVLPSLA